ncbi:MAG: class 1 fructose-bisphosphatase [Myxococcota bacterium]
MGNTPTDRGPVRENLTTLDAHLRFRKSGRAELVPVIGSIALACKAIASKVRRARIEDVLGKAGEVNVQGEKQEKLDVISNDLMVHTLSACPSVGVLASEEEDEAIVVRPRSDGGEFVVLFDPLDGSSNIDVAAGVGTIFSVLRNEETDENTARAALQAGSRQVAAGYVLYGSSVLMVLTLGDGVDMFVLDPMLGEFVLVKERVTMPETRKIYSINEAYREDFPDGIQRYLDHAHSTGYALRYIGSMVADVHRTLLKGGVFLYPPTAKAPEGKLRLMYEGNPMAMVIEQAGGVAGTGAQRILDIQPAELHQRCPVVLGSSGEVEVVARHH